MKCKDCIYCTGTKCHGHGDYWANCKLLEKLYNETKNKELDLWDTICYEEYDCIIIAAINESRKWANKEYREIFEEKSRTIYKALKQYEPPQNEWNRNYRIKQRDELIEFYKEKFNF